MLALLPNGELPRAAADAGVTAAVGRSGAVGSVGAGGEVVGSDGPWIRWLSDVGGAGVVEVAGSWMLGAGLGAPSCWC